MRAHQMEFVLTNLIHNAAKYSPVSSPVSISAWITRTNELQFSVEDEGPGISARDCPRLVGGE